jgi:hypothetical protein
MARKKHADEFKKRWKSSFVKAGILYAKRKPKDIIKILNVDRKMLKDMGIDSFRVKKVF